jgi:bifunctional DNA-binding transcriptional regulator/antitoxin component of YhaV-PrlF toxin-antitoxin module
MMTETILKPIWNGQYTIPQDWRRELGVDKKHIRARFEWRKIILEPMEREELDWDVRAIRLDELSDETIAAIRESEKNYRAGNKAAFISHDEFWDDI